MWPSEAARTAVIELSVSGGERNECESSGNKKAFHDGFDHRICLDDMSGA
jgi:hypothetical protein